MCNFLEYKGTFMLHIIAMFQAGVSKGSVVMGEGGLQGTELINRHKSYIQTLCLAILHLCSLTGR